MSTTARPVPRRRRALVPVALLATLLVAAPGFAQASAQQPASGSSSGKPPGAPALPGQPAPEKPKDTSAKPQGAAKPAKAPKGAPVFRVNAFLEAGYQGFAATETFDAALGKSGGGVFGGGASLTHRSGLLFQVDVTRFAADGERAFVYNGEVFKLGIPLRVETMPIEFTFGYKFFTRPPSPKKPARPTVPPPARRDAWSSPVEGAQAKPPQAPPAKPATAARPGAARGPRWGGLKPYAGGGFGIVRYKETGGFASTGDDVDDSFTSVHAVGGVQIPIWKWVGAAAEFNYRWVKDALGEGGLSKEFGEDDLGGPSFRVKITIGM